MNFLRLLLINHTQFYLAMFAVLSFVAIVNLLHNPYTKQNAKLKRFNKKTLKKPNSIVCQIQHLPSEYQRQWRAYVNSGCAKPSTVFEFVKRPRRYLLWFAHFVAGALCLVYIAMSILLQDKTMFATQMAFCFLSALVILLSKLVGQINLAHARRVFGKFLHDLNAVTAILKGEGTITQTELAVPNDVPQACNQTEATTQSTNKTLAGGNTLLTDKPTGDTTMEGTTQLPQATPKTPAIPQNKTPTPTTPTAVQSDDIVQKAVQILHQKGLDCPRTVDEQRKLNLALNNLLQACCKR